MATLQLATSIKTIDSNASTKQRRRKLPDVKPVMMKTVESEKESNYVEKKMATIDQLGGSCKVIVQSVHGDSIYSDNAAMKSERYGVGSK